MKPILSVFGLLFLFAGASVAQSSVQTIVKGLANPESVVTDGKGRVFVSTIGEFNKDDDGAIMQIKNGKAVPFCKGFDDPKGLAWHQNWFYVADKTRIVKINAQGQSSIFVAANQFPAKPLFLNDVVVDPESGTLYVSDSGDLKGKGGAIYRISKLGNVSVLTNHDKNPALHSPNGLSMDGKYFIRMIDFGTGTLYRIRASDGQTTKIADGLGGSDGLAWDMNGEFFTTDWKNGKVYGIARPGQKPVLLTGKFESAADLCYDQKRRALLVPDMKAGTLSVVAATVPGNEIDRTPLPIETTLAFPKIKWTNWSPVTPDGKIMPHRPIVLTHAGDGSDRIFLATQRGVIHVFPNDPKVEKTEIFMDLEKQVFYFDKQNEQGLLGMAFHPNYKKNGEFFLFYTIEGNHLTNVLSRFRVSKTDPNRADPNSEEEIFRIKRPFWNHDGGTILFGPDGYLYVALGDGGSANDPMNNGQNLGTLLGTILRIDVDKKDPGKNYAIPKDNPFVGKKGARPEIWAYGLRNVWRMAFDRKTNELWAADVGQNLYEEINIITKGANCGWKLREGLHPFSNKGVGPQPDMLEPIWEYHHDVGKSVTGGFVYRGKQLPELEGAYVYGDYVSCKIWALWYDANKKRVIANRPIADRNKPILSFGEDQQGELYLLTTSVSGEGVYRLSKAAN